MTTRVRELINSLYGYSIENSIIHTTIIKVIEESGLQNTLLESRVEKYFYDILNFLKTDNMDYLLSVLKRMPIIIKAENMFVDDIICRDLLNSIRFSRCSNENIDKFLNIILKNRERTPNDIYNMMKKKFKNNAYYIFRLFDKELREITMYESSKRIREFFTIYLEALDEYNVMDKSLSTVKNISRLITDTYFHTDSGLNNHIIPTLKEKGLLKTYYLCDIYKTYDIYDFVSDDIINIFTSENASEIHDTLIDVKNKLIVAMCDTTEEQIEIFGKDFFRHVLDFENGKIKGVEEILRFISNELLQRVNKKLDNVKEEQTDMNKRRLRTLLI